MNFDWNRIESVNCFCLINIFFIAWIWKMFPFFAILYFFCNLFYNFCCRFPSYSWLNLFQVFKCFWSYCELILQFLIHGIFMLIKSIDLSMLIFITCITNFLMNSNILLVEASGSLIYLIMPSANSDNLTTSFPVCAPLIVFLA